MKKLLIALLAVMALAPGAAVAADLGPPVFKAPPPPPPPPPNWTGCYLNVGGGGGIWDSRHQPAFGAVPLTVSVDSGGQGWLGVAGGGCDYQFRALNLDLVIGALGDYDWMSLHGTSSSLIFAGNETEQAAWAGGGRLGVLITPNLLTYTDGGYSGTRFGQISGFDEVNGVYTGLGFAAHDYNGWFIGGGAEYALNWILPGLYWRNEYRYASYQSASLPLVSFTATPVPISISEHTDKSVQTFATELVWRFNWFGPVVARY